MESRRPLGEMAQESFPAEENVDQIARAEDRRRVLPYGTVFDAHWKIFTRLPMRILLVDDESLIRWSLYQSLTARGHEVTQAGGGNEAISLLQTNSFDVILTDLRLPGVDGFKVIEVARASSPDIPVIMISAHGNKNIQKKILEHRINYFVDKPFVVDEVALLVESVQQLGKQ